MHFIIQNINTTTCAHSARSSPSPTSLAFLRLLVLSLLLLGSSCFPLVRLGILARRTHRLVHVAQRAVAIGRRMLQDRLVRPIGDLNHPTCFAHEVSAYRSRAEAEDDLLLALFHPQVTLRTEERAQARGGERVSTHASGPTKRHAARVRLPARRSHVRPQRHGKYRRQHTTSQIRLDGQALLDTSRRSPRRAPPSRAPCRTRPAARAHARDWLGWG